MNIFEQDKERARKIIAGYVEPDPEKGKRERMAENIGVNRTEQTMDLIFAEKLDEISEYYSDCGVMRKVKETFPDDDTLNQWADYFISLDMAMIEILGGELNAAQRPQGI
jgi:hypothetical protein